MSADPVARAPKVTLRLSVVIPAKNDAANLERCLRALAIQSGPIHEVIVVDNASSDDTAAVGRKYGARVVFEASPGIAAAAARGYDSAVGEIIGRLDADSTPADDWAEQILKYFAAHPAVAAVTGGAVFTDGPVALRRVGAALYLFAYFSAVTGALAHLPVFGSNCAFRLAEWRRVSSQVHRHDLLVHDDMDLAYHLGPTGSVRFSPQIRVGISSRPFSDGRAALRIRRGFHTVFVHWPHDLPWARAWRRLALLRGPAN